MGVNDEQFRETGHLRCRRMHVQLSEHPADRHLHSRRNLRLAFEKQHPELKKCRTDLAVALLVQTVRQVDALYFATKRRRKGSYLQQDISPLAIALCYHTPGQGLPTRNSGLAPLRGVYFWTRPVLTSAV